MPSLRLLLPHLRPLIAHGLALCFHTQELVEPLVNHIPEPLMKESSPTKELSSMKGSSQIERLSDASALSNGLNFGVVWAAQELSNSTINEMENGSLVDVHFTGIDRCLLYSDCMMSCLSFHNKRSAVSYNQALLLIVCHGFELQVKEMSKKSEGGQDKLNQRDESLVSSIVSFLYSHLELRISLFRNIENDSL